MGISLPVLMWGISFLLLIISALWLVKRRKNYITATTIYGFCILFPVIWVGHDCYVRSSSEACVWGQAFMPFYLVAALIFGSVFYLIWIFCLTLYEKRQKP